MTGYLLSTITGDSPQTWDSYYHFMQSHMQTNSPLVTWHTLWDSLGWVWGFIGILTIGTLLWVQQYRSTRRRNRLAPLERWGGYTTEASGPALTQFFVAMVILLVGADIAIIVGHLLWVQTF